MHPVHLILLLLPTAATSKGEECTARCDRLNERTVQRTGISLERIKDILGQQRPSGTLRDVCWRLHDRIDCLKRCPKDKEREKYARDVRLKCNAVLGDLAADLKCVSKFRSFMEVKCSTFLKEAVSLRVHQKNHTLPDRETCRFLYLNSVCLENTGRTYCPSTAMFRRQNFRDYFLSFIIPEEDRLFDEADLDSCQTYRLEGSEERTSEEVDEELTTMINRWEDEQNERKTHPMTTRTRATDRNQLEITTLLSGLLVSSQDSTTFSSIEVSIDEIEKDLTTRTATITATQLQETGYTTTPDAILSTKPDRTPESVEHVESTLEIDADHALVRKIQDETRTSPSNTRKDILEETKATTREEAVATTGQADDGIAPVRSTPLGTVESSTWSSDDDLRIVVTSSRRNVFSDDSMENNPPNFYWSSARYRTSTLSANNGRHLSSLEIVEPVEVDTSTLLGADFPYGPVETEHVPWTTPSPEKILQPPRTVIVKQPNTQTTPKSTGRISVTFSPKTEVRRLTTSESSVTLSHVEGTATTTAEHKSTPLLRNGGVVVKTIRRWGDPESDEEGGEADKRHMSPVIDEEDLDLHLSVSLDYYPHDDVTHRNSHSGTALSDKEHLLLINLILVALTLFSLVCILTCYICCKRSTRPVSNKY